MALAGDIEQLIIKSSMMVIGNLQSSTFRHSQFEISSESVYVSFSYFFFMNLKSYVQVLTEFRNLICRRCLCEGGICFASLHRLHDRPLIIENFTVQDNDLARINRYYSQSSQ